MSFSLPIRLPRSRNARFICLAFLMLAAAVVISLAQRRPRPWPIDQVPITFWAWRTYAPREMDVRQAVNQNYARAIFLHAGQIDYREGQPARIPAGVGPLPDKIDLHLVYNATPDLLVNLESIDEAALATEISQAFHEDYQRAALEHAHVVGVQLDLDVPTRLLARYERVLRALRGQLPPGMKLSITGLPTWMHSSQLRSTLTQVDFWTPQFYGAKIPWRVDQLIPISTPEEVERFVNKARALGKPFYAGLGAYSWVLHYDKSGRLIKVRGNMDRSVIDHDLNLELIDQRQFNFTTEWRYAYRARADGFTGGLEIRTGEVLVVDVPSSESLRKSARIVRQWAGEKLLGICVFRMPAADDPANLTSSEVAAALSDQDLFAEREKPPQLQDNAAGSEEKNR
jgi:hypothetical protein